MQWDTQHNITMLFFFFLFKQGENCIRVTGGKDADGAGPDSRTACFLRLAFDSVQKHSIHFYKSKNDEWWADFEPFSTSCRVFDTDNDACRRGWSRCGEPSTTFTTARSRADGCETTVVCQVFCCILNSQSFISPPWKEGILEKESELGANVDTHQNTIKDHEILSSKSL